MKELIALFGTTQMQWIVILIAIDVVLGIIAAIVKKNLLLGKLANFMKGPILAYVLGFAVLEMVGQALPKLAYIVLVAFVLIVIALLVSILKNLGRLGLPLPGILKK
ncbi:phage holin family protein [Candidatus Roizmanbacteria bacterium]|nr:phage holin family protein [Candidatus Roizmanbacteria bacterium]